METLICPKFEKAMNLLNKRWVGMIVYQLLPGPQRFCTIEGAIGISGRVLSQRLKELEEENVVKREVYPETPVRIEYSLTDKGKALEPIIKNIEIWSQKWED